MNLINKNITFRFANKDDISLIMRFIKKYWKKNHLCGTNRKIFEYEYCHHRKVNFMIAFNKNNKKINAIQGFIPYSNSKKNLHICGSILLVRPDVTLPFLGIETMKNMLEKKKPKSYCGIGTNPLNTKPLVEKFFNRYTSKMVHHYFLNESVKEFKIANISKKFQHKSIKEKFFYEKILTFKEVINKIKLNKIYKNLPFKSSSYIKKRYFENPSFKYEFFIINKKSLLIGREIYLRKYKRRIFTLVDFIGLTNHLGKINNLIKSLLYVKNYEYIDILCTGNISKFLIKSGFRIKTSQDKNIIPIYFNPFVKKNIEIFYESSDKKMVFFKADADQDRRNI